ncbi:MAG: dihydroneopterin triphosphate diphosphatase [Burkholderiaceae bacterium]
MSASPALRPHKIPESVLVVVHTSAFDVLLIERADARGHWQSVTGSKERDGETLVAACVREVVEETGIAIGTAAVPMEALVDCGLVNVYEIYPRWRHRYAPGVTHNTEHVFALLVPAGTPVALSPREHVAWMWLPWREAADKCFSPSNAEAILHLPRWRPREPSA